MSRSIVVEVFSTKMNYWSAAPTYKHCGNVYCEITEGQRYRVRVADTTSPDAKPLSRLIVDGRRTGPMTKYLPATYTGFELDGAQCREQLLSGFSFPSKPRTQQLLFCPMLQHLSVSSAASNPADVSEFRFCVAQPGEKIDAGARLILVYQQSTTSLIIINYNTVVCPTTLCSHTAYGMHQRARSILCCLLLHSAQRLLRLLVRSLPSSTRRKRSKRSTILR